jgi:hypothetical protein
VQRADRALRRLRGESVEPVSVYSGASASREGYVIGVAANETGVVGYYTGTDSGTRTFASAQQLAEAVGSADVHTFALLDRDMPLPEAIALLDALLASGKHPHLAAGSPMGDDVYYTFPVDASAQAPVQLDLGTRGSVLRGATWPDGHTICYSSIIPSDQLQTALEAAFGSATESSVAINLAPDTDLQRALNLAAAMSRPGLSLHLALAATDPSPASCAQ